MPEYSNKKSEEAGKDGWLILLKKGYQRFLKIRGTPSEIALGFALGIFIGMTPTMGVQMICAVFFAALLGWNKISSAIGVWITNPVTAPFIYGVNYYIGEKILKFLKIPMPFNGPSSTQMAHLLKKTPEIFIALTVGGTILGIILSVIAYYLSYFIILRYRRNIKTRFTRKLRKARELRALKNKRSHDGPAAVL